MPMPMPAITTGIIQTLTEAPASSSDVVSIGIDVPPTTASKKYVVKPRSPTMTEQFTGNPGGAIIPGLQVLDCPFG